MADVKLIGFDAIALAVGSADVLGTFQTAKLAGTRRKIDQTAVKDSAHYLRIAEFEGTLTLSKLIEGTAVGLSLLYAGQEITWSFNGSDGLISGSGFVTAAGRDLGKDNQTEDITVDINGPVSGL